MHSCNVAKLISSSFVACVAYLWIFIFLQVETKLHIDDANKLEGEYEVIFHCYNGKNLLAFTLISSSHALCAPKLVEEKLKLQ